MRIELEKTGTINPADLCPELAEKCRGLRAKLPLYHDALEQAQCKDSIEKLKSEGRDE